METGGGARTLDQVLPFWLRDEGLELCGCERVDQPCLGDDEEQDLRPSQSGQLVGLRF